MRFAALFWFYREAALSANHLQVARVFNPHTAFYGLYGGPPAAAADFRAALGADLDDFHVFADERDPRWKWRHGDQLIIDWYLRRGHALAWDTIVVVQWDTLVFAPFEHLFASLAEGEMLLLGLRALREVESDWWWTSPAMPDNRVEYLAFLAHLRERLGYRDEPHCCLFVAACIPRRFLEGYAGIEQPTLGFLEYKLPMYAQVFGVPIRAGRGIEPYWNAGPPERRVQDYALNAVGREIAAEAMLRHLRDARGARLFHPVRRPVSATVRASCARSEAGGG